MLNKHGDANSQLLAFALGCGLTRTFSSARNAGIARRAVGNIDGATMDFVSLH